MDIFNSSEFKKNPGAQFEEIVKVQKILNIEFPQQYVDWLLLSNGGEGEVGNSYLALWCLEEIIPLNEAYEVHEFIPGIILIGSDGGDTAFGIDTYVSPHPFIEVPFIGMDRKEIRVCGETFADFLDYLSRL
ncbi:MAG: SMI1/KNR4 family protein [Anaerolineales bacterium]|jgi:hypothetical protein|nr:SMI1/KNR4 family protein [Anaerolineales bacterium]